MSEVGMPRRLVVVDGRVLMQACTLYKRHPVAVLNVHHIVPESWWRSAGKAVASPTRALCPNCHASTHAALDGLLAGRDVSALPQRCVALAREGVALAQQNGLTPAPTL
jgi:hypothetical protein